MTQKTIRVMIVDDHAIVRKGIRALLATESDIQVIGEASDGVEAIAQAQALHPDVILMDLVMPKIDGIEATRQITASQSGVRILVLTSFAADDNPWDLPGARSFQRSRPAHWVTSSRIRDRMICSGRFIRFIWGSRHLSLRLPARCFPNLPTRQKSH